MKKLIGLSAALVLVRAIAPAQAADLGIDARVYQTRPVAVIFRWSGFYIGLHGGGGFGKKDENSVPFPIATSFNINDPTNSVIYPAPMSIGISGALAGGQVGANFQYESWVWGIEGQASWANLSGTSDCNSTSIRLGIVLTGSSTCTSKIDALGTAAIRFGYAFDRLLVYGKAGGAFTNDNYQARLFSNAFTPFPSATVGAQLLFSANELRWGLMAGLGAEWAFTDSWSAKLEWNYMDMGSRSVQFTEVNGLDQPAHHVADVSERIHVVKIGVNYRWGPKSLWVEY